MNKARRSAVLVIVLAPLFILFFSIFCNGSREDQRDATQSTDHKSKTDVKPHRSSVLDIIWIKQLGNAHNTREAVWTIKSVIDPKTRVARETLVDIKNSKEISDSVLQSELFNKPADFSEKDILAGSVRAMVTAEGDPVVELDFKPDSAKRFEAWTGKHIGEYLAIFINKKLLTPPVIDAAIPGGKGQIHANLTLVEVESITNTLNAASTPSKPPKAK